MIIGVIRWIYIFYFNLNQKNNYIQCEIYILLLELFNIIIESIYFGYIKGLMEYKFFSPYLCCFITGIINTPIIIIIYIAVSFIKCDNKFFCEEENKPFDDITQAFSFDLKKYLILIVYTFVHCIYAVLINRTINNFTVYHLLIPKQISNFIYNIIEYWNPEKKNNKNYDLIIILVLFFIEFLMYQTFLEIIELNCCGLSKYIRKNIKKRAEKDLSYEDNRDSVLDYNDEDNDNASDVNEDDNTKSNELFTIN
jgi:hypothetical protein